MDDRVDEPGEFAVLGRGIDVFSPGAPNPIRILLEDGLVGSIRSYNPLTQLTDDAVDTVTLAPSTELRVNTERSPMRPTQNRWKRACSARATSSSGCSTCCQTRGSPGLPALTSASTQRFADRRRPAGARQTKRPSATAERFYLNRAALRSALSKSKVEFGVEGVSPTPDFIVELDPSKSAAEFVAEKARAGFRVVLAGSSSELDRLVKALARRLKQEVGAAETAARRGMGRPGGIVRLDVDIGEGFIDDDAALTMVATADVFGIGEMRQAARPHGSPRSRSCVSAMSCCTRITASECCGRSKQSRWRGSPRIPSVLNTMGAPRCSLRWRNSVAIWRYGADQEAVTLDRLKGDGWTKRRAQLDREIQEVAEHLVSLASEREEKRARIFKPPRSAYARFAAKFPYPETTDQSAAIAAVIGDLSSGKAMNRLICGDVGFGKTEVALRAAAVVALNGGQVAVVAPTTVLARQHFETFSRRFEDVKVALLSRVVGNPEAKRTKAGLADGSIRHRRNTSIAAKDVTFADLALLIIDEEHRFGAKFKQNLRRLAPQLHVVSMSATRFRARWRRP